MTSATRRTLVVVFLGVVLRLLFLLWVGEIELWADEGQYVVQAVALNRFGFYLGSPNWVWPPGYPAFLALWLGWFGEHGLFAARLAQVGLSAVVGASVMAIARRLFSERAALVAGVGWALYLPLIAYTHYLWPETLFLALLLPAVQLFLTVVDPRSPARGAPWRLALVGALLGGTLYLKEAALPLLVFLPLILIVRGGALARAERMAGAAVLVLAAVGVVLPWTLRNVEVYGRVVPSGSTLGENLWQGVNAQYINWDYGGLDRKQLVADSPAYEYLAKPPKGAQLWPRSSAANTIDRSSENSAAAKAFVREHPGYYVRSRLKKAADWLTPLSFFVRHQRNDMYVGSIASRAARVPLVLWCVGLTMLVLGAGALGLFAVPRGAARWTLLAVVATFLSGVLVVSMSRYRVQVEPFLLVAAAGVVTGARAEKGTLARALGLAALAVVVLAWLVNSVELAAVLGRTL
jgi:4-amino-4-deoxy-L-arabinose transferase-like glycosyltransferase